MTDIRSATISDLQAITALYQEAQRWLAVRGLEQWQAQPGEHTGELLGRVSLGAARSMERGTCFVAVEGDAVIGTITVNERADPEFWQPEDQPVDALYVHRMIVSRAAKGAGVGGTMLDFAELRAARERKRWLRLDAWRTNMDLHRYYESQGMCLVRIVSLDHRGSGALFQRDVRPTG